MTAKTTASTTAKTLETKALQADLAQTFAAFKAANDQRLAEIEAKQADGLTEAKVARIDAALDAQSKSLAHLAQSLHGGAVPGTKSTDPAWESYIRRGDASGLLEGKSIGSTTEDGAFIAPVETESRIDRVMAEASPFRTLATVRRIGAGVFRKPVSNGAALSGWAGETDARLQTQAPELSLLDFPVGELYAMPAATQALLDDSVADVDAWLADEVRDVFSAQESAAFVAGDGVNKPRGFVNDPAIGTVAAGAGGDLDADAPLDALLDLIYAPETRYRAGGSFVMNRRTLSRLRKVRDADGNYIWQPAASAGGASTLLGFRVTEMEDMPDIAAGSKPIAFGDFRRGYLIVDRQGIQVLRDPFSAKPYVLFYTTKRVGGGVQDADAIKLLSIRG